MTWIIVVQTPRLNVVLGELSVGEEHHRVGVQLHIALGVGGLTFTINTVNTMAYFPGFVT